MGTDVAERYGPVVARVKSAREPDNWSCQYPGYRFRQACRHIEAAKDLCLEDQLDSAEMRVALEIESFLCSRIPRVGRFGSGLRAGVAEIVRRYVEAAGARPEKRVKPEVQQRFVRMIILED